MTFSYGNRGCFSDFSGPGVFIKNLLQKSDQFYGHWYILFEGHIAIFCEEGTKLPASAGKHLCIYKERKNYEGRLYGTNKQNIPQENRWLLTWNYTHNRCNGKDSESCFKTCYDRISTT
jgi:hypothetical protein